MASRILDMGDVLTLIEQAEKAFDAEQAAKMAEKVATGQDFTLADFLVQMQQMKNMGSMKKMLGMLPGMGQMREAIENFDEREVDRIEAIIRSMTPRSGTTPRSSTARGARIARGSGVTTSDVNQLLERFAGAQKMMRQMSRGGGMPGMPGMGSLPGMGGKKARGRQAPQRKVKGKSGNPAKRAAQERAAAARAAGSSPVRGAVGLRVRRRAHGRAAVRHPGRPAAAARLREAARRPLSRGRPGQPPAPGCDPQPPGR